jgi:hypothetical protein
MKAEVHLVTRVGVGLLFQGRYTGRHVVGSGEIVIPREHIQGMLKVAAKSDWASDKLWAGIQTGALQVMDDFRTGVIEGDVQHVEVIPAPTGWKSKKWRSMKQVAMSNFVAVGPTDVDETYFGLDEVEELFEQCGQRIGLAGC